MKVHSPSFIRRPVRLAVQAALLCLAAGSMPAFAQAEPAARAASVKQPFTIPAGTLAEALSRYAAAAGVTLAFDAGQLGDLRSSGLQGQYTVEQGFAKLLSGTGFDVVPSGDKRYSLRRLPQSGSAVLPEVKVTAGMDTPLASRQEQGYRNRSSSVSGFREQEVLNTPFSTSTISAEVIEDQQAKSLADVVKNDPSVTLADNPMWFDRVNVRGFYLGVNAIYRDGLSINDQGSIALENKAAVEVNKGLSALRYGATSPGGTINYVIKRPTDVPLRKINLTGDGYGSVGAHADFGGRFGEYKQFGYRINVAAEELRTHLDAFKGDKQFLSGFFDWHVNDQLTLELDVEYQRVNKLNVATPGVWSWASTAEARSAFSRMKPDTYIYQPWGMSPNEQTNIAGRAHYRFNQDWKATLAVQDSKLKRDQNAAWMLGTVSPTGEYLSYNEYTPGQERNNRSYQVVVQGDVRQGDMRHELAFGYDSVRRDMVANDGVFNLMGMENLYNPRGLSRPAVPSSVGPSYLSNRVEQDSFFVTDNLVFNEQWRVFGGLRQTSLRQYAAAGPTASLDKAYGKSAVNPTAGLIYKPSPAGTLYASYAEGIEQGGVVPDVGYTNSGAVLAPLESKQYEIGAKWEVANDMLVTAALFEIDKGLERDNISGGLRTRVQDGRQLHRGVELTAGGQVTNQLRLIAGLAYLKAEVKETDNAALIGKRPQGVPDWQANLYADYSLNRQVQGLSVNGGVYYGGKKAIDDMNTWMADSFVRLDAGVRYVQKLSNGQEMTYRLTVYNLTDKEYLANTTSGYLQFGEPRAVRLSASYKF